MASCRVSVGDLISDEPLDLSMKNNRHEKENLERGPLVMQSNTPQQTNVVVARLWQTSEVMRFQESPQQLEKVNEQPIHHRSQESQLQVLQQVEKVEERQLNCIRTPTLPQRKKRFRFTGQQINFMEQIFEIKQLQLTAVEFLETARLLNVNELLVRNWFRRRFYRWKKQVECSSKFVKILPAPAQETSSSSTSPSSSAS